MGQGGKRKAGAGIAQGGTAMSWLIQWVYKILPAVIFYVDDVGTWNTGTKGGRNIGPLIWLRTDKRDDRGLLAHELTHARQAWRMPLLHDVLYALSPRYRLQCEVAAYRVQLGYTDNPLAVYRFAEFIAGNYGLDVSQGEALKLLTENQ